MTKRGFNVGSNLSIPNGFMSTRQILFGKWLQCQMGNAEKKCLKIIKITTVIVDCSTIIKKCFLNSTTFIAYFHESDFLFINSYSTVTI